MTKKGYEYNKKIGLRYNVDILEIEKNRLSGKKVMLPLSTGYGDRLSHSQDVLKISEYIYNYLKKDYGSDPYIKKLQINKIRTMAKWHDVGHCPYGHSGEDKLNELISENGDFYWDSFYSGYKHNLLSAKKLLDLKMNISWDIIDGVVKHSHVLPKNFNVSRAKYSNILKLNYIFNCDKTYSVVENNGIIVATNHSWYTFMKDFIMNFPCEICKLEKYDLINKNKSVLSNECDIKICDDGKKSVNCKYCVKKENNENIKMNITQYLLFPHPFTIEGEIIKIADEISALVRDIEYYSLFLRKNNVSEYQIIKAKVNDRLTILKSKLIGKNKNTELIELIDTLFETSNNSEKVIDFLIKEIDYNNANFEILDEKNFSKKEIIVNWNSLTAKAYCRPLIGFKQDTANLFNEIKRCIYSIIHKDRTIEEDNQKGKQKLKKAFDYYYNHPEEFLEINQHLNEELNVITNFIADMGFETLSEKINFSKKKIQTNENYMKLLNSFRREIVFYLANLTEEEVSSFVTQFKKRK